MSSKHWKDFSDSELNREYSPSSAASDFEGTIASYTSESARVLASAPSQRLPYGESPDEYLILFPARSGGTHPMVVFLHGGYWQELSAEDSVFPAEGFLEQGVSYAAINYTLAPAASVSQIVEQCERALSRLIAHFPDTRFVLAGSSAGAHLAAMLGARSWNIAGQEKLAGLVLLSGVYDLRPLVRTYINTPLKLDADSATAVSPALIAARHTAPALVAWGQHETAEFKRQSLEYSELLSERGDPVRALEVAPRDHFDIVFDLSRPDTPLGQEVARLVTGDRPPPVIPLK